VTGPAERVDLAEQVDLAERVDLAEARIRPYIRTTPLDPMPALDNVWLKCEHLQYTGSFKPRGALSKILVLSPDQRERGVVAASSGNHGLGVAYAIDAVGGKATVFVPNHAAPTKVEAIRRYGVEVRHVGDDGVEAELAAREYADRTGMPYVSPYNDLDVVAGQGTIGLELIEQSESGLDAVVVAVGGGGLVSGVASVLRRRYPGITVIGASPAYDAAMAASVEAGRIVTVDPRPTLSDGTAGGIEPGSVTFELCRDLVDRWVLVSEEQIAEGIRLVLESQHQLVEGAAGVAVAACLAVREELAGQRIAVISCGANISADRLGGVLSAR
jgi:threonine dehydratase